MSTPDISKQPRVTGGDPSSKGGQWKETARPGATLNLEDDSATGAVTYDSTTDIATQNRARDAETVRAYVAAWGFWTTEERDAITSMDDAEISRALWQARASFDPDNGSRRRLRNGSVEEYAALIALRTANVDTGRCPVCVAVFGRHREGCGFAGNPHSNPRETALQVAHESAADLPPGWGSTEEPDGVLSVLHDRDLDPEILARITPSDLAAADEDYLAPAAQRASDLIRREYSGFTDFDNLDAPDPDLPVNEWTKKQAGGAGLAVAEHILRREIAAGRLTDEHRDGIDPESLQAVYELELAPAIDKIEDRFRLAYGS